MAKPIFGNYDWIPGHLENQDVFIVASGPSLAGFDFSRLDGKKKIVISHASHFVKPDFLVFLDPPVMRTLKQDFTKEDYRTIVGRNINRKPEGKLARIQYASEPMLDPRHGFFGSRSTGYFSLNLALSMRANNIYLLGFDCCSLKGKENFYDTQEVKGYRLGNGNGMRYEKMAVGFDKFEKFKNIYNLSDISIIKTFKKVPVEEIL